MLNKIELSTIAEVIEDLDHYRILKVSPMASEDEVREAFHREALQFHPDQYFSDEDPERAELAKKIYSHLVSAYRELIDPEQRVKYDRKIHGGDASTSESSEQDFSEDEITSIKRKPSFAQKSPGQKFFQLAEKAYASRDLKSALMNLQIALSADPGNAQYERLKKEIEAQLER